MKLYLKLLSLPIVISFLLVSCDNDNDELVNPPCPEGTIDCTCFGCVTTTFDVQTCEDFLSFQCNEDIQYYDFDLCECFCQNEMCGLDCDQDPDPNCLLPVTVDCECPLPTTQRMSATIILEERGDTIEWSSGSVSGTFTANSFNIIGGFSTDYIDLEQTGIQISTGVSYPFLPPSGMASMRIPEIGNEIWTNIPGIDLGQVFINEFDSDNNTCLIQFEFPMSNGSEMAWVRNGVVRIN